MNSGKLNYCDQSLTSIINCANCVYHLLYPSFMLRGIYTETIKLCPLGVYVCQFQMDERISFKFSPYKF